ncbi:MAG: hypothetical protein ACTSUR_04435 [Candidatus Heimdallarchaeaceae archaeon]
MNYRRVFQDVFMIRKILVVKHEQCLPVFEIDLNSQISIDPSMICDILESDTTNIQKISSSSYSTKVKYYGFVVVSTSFGAYTTYLFAERELDEMIDQKIMELSKWFDLVLGYDSTEIEYSKEFREYYKKSISSKVAELFNLWLLFPLEPNIDYLPNAVSYTRAHEKILEYIILKKQVSVMKIINEFQEFPQEEVLKIIFDLIKDNNILTRSSDEYTQTFFEIEETAF